jgi:uncharacterized protein YjiS (DUF1127 family)
MIFAFFKSVQKAISAYLDYRRTVYELNHLSGRDLADLGIHRCDIEFIARKSAFKVAE